MFFCRCWIGSGLMRLFFQILKKKTGESHCFFSRFYHTGSGGNYSILCLISKGQSWIANREKIRVLVGYDVPGLMQAVSYGLLSVKSDSTITHPFLLLLLSYVWDMGYKLFSLMHFSSFRGRRSGISVWGKQRSCER